MPCVPSLPDTRVTGARRCHRPSPGSHPTSALARSGLLYFLTSTYLYQGMVLAPGAQKTLEIRHFFGLSSALIGCSAGGIIQVRSAARVARQAVVGADRGKRSLGMPPFCETSGRHTFSMRAGVSFKACGCLWRPRTDRHEGPMEGHHRPRGCCAAGRGDGALRPFLA